MLNFIFFQIVKLSYDTWEFVLNGKNQGYKMTKMTNSEQCRTHLRYSHMLCRIRIS